MKKQNRSSKTLDSAPELSSSPCDMARFTDYFFGQKTASKKSLNQTKPASNLKQK
ncbi:MAG: hypothetical protein ABJV04_03590 [Aliiglaciecola sp.]|uniref:hypothetical protein n=1 Tax=Aliiglaciecola sp. TaxID=1872441 RepID=UPI003297FE9E